MAKAKKSKKSKAGRKADPLARNDAKDEKLRDEKIIPMIEKLSSPTAADRAMAVSAIISMCEDAKLRSLLLKEKLIQTVMTQSLSDNSEEIAAEAYGLLRNLVAEEGYDVGIFLYRQDILTSIEAGLSKIQTSLQNKESLLKMTGEQRNLIFEYFENLVGLISLISSSDEEIFTAVDKRLSQIGTFISQQLTNLLQIQASTAKVSVPKSLIDSFLELCYILSESNANFISQFPVSLADEIIKSSDTSSIAKVHANGFKYNAYIEAQVENSSSPDSNDQITNDILTSLVDIISSINLNETKDQLHPVIENAEPNQITQQTSLAIEARSSINAIQVCLELFTAIAETIEVDPSIIYSNKDENEVDEEEMDEDVDLSDEAYFEKSVNANSVIHAHEDEIPNDIEIDDVENDTTPISSVTFLNQRVVPLCVEFLSTSELCSRSMAALNNICWTLQSKIPISDNDWKTHAEQLWSNLAVDTYLKSLEIEIVTSCIGILSAIAITFKGEVPIEINNQSVISTISTQCITLKPSTPYDEWVELATRSISLLKTLGQVQARHTITQEVTTFLFTLIESPLETPTPVLYESINAIFDLFGDKSYDYDEPIFVNQNLVSKLKELLPKVRQATKRIDRKKNRDLRAIGDETSLNLARFIDYKTKERQ